MSAQGEGRWEEGGSGLMWRDVQCLGGGGAGRRGCGGGGGVCGMRSRGTGGESFGAELGGEGGGYGRGGWWSECTEVAVGDARGGGVRRERGLLLSRSL